MVLVLGLAVGGPACLFETREDQPPDDSSCPVTILNTPDAVFEAMEEALERCQQDANYERALSANFVFSPTLTDSLDQDFIGTGAFDNWTKEVELDVTNSLLAEARSLNMSFSPSRLINQNTFVRFRVPYTLDVVTKAAPGDTAYYAGVAEFDVRNEGGNWRITFWNEVETVQGKSTWGYLRGVLRLRG